MSDSDRYKFTIVDGFVTEVYEYDDGVWEREPIEANELYQVSGSNVFRYENYGSFIETKIYSDPDGDGVYVESGSRTTDSPSDDSSSDDISDDDSSGDSHEDDWYKFTLVDGQVTEVYEYDDGVWELDSIDSNETFEVSGDNIIETETYGAFVETKVYTDPDGDGIYIELHDSSDDGRYKDSGGNDDWHGGRGDDHFYAGLGDDSIDGGDDTDTVYYEDHHDDYSLTFSNGSILVASLQGQTGRDTLINVERLSFLDECLAFDSDDANSAGGIYRTYQAAFNRTPDKVGFGFWLAQADDGMSAVDIAERFTWTQEFMDEYGVRVPDHFLAGSDIQSVVEGFYRNVLEREYDEEGRDYYTGVIERHEKTVGQVLAEISDSQENRDNLESVIQNGMTYDLWLG